MPVIIDPNLKQIFKKVAVDFDLPEIVITSIYYNYLKTLKSQIEELPLKVEDDILPEEEFKKLTTSFNLKFLGKIHTNYSIYKTKHLIYKNGHNKSKENKTDI